MNKRAELITQAQCRLFDLLIVGGGIVGAGIARDAAMRGLAVALIEQGDFASGASSKTSKLIHGGLRYLEHGHVGLVRESLRERQVLRAILPAYVHPLSILLPVYAGDSRPTWKIRLGLSLYDLLAFRWNLRRHRMLSPRRAEALEPGLRVEGLRAAGLYADCRMDDARICLANLLQAVEFGAVCVNYAWLEEFLKMGHRLCGGVAADALTGRSFEIHAKVVVNAAGPWADEVRRLNDRQAARRLAPTKGIHLIVPRVAREALFVQASADGRMLFILPWDEDASLIGTTEREVDGPLDALCAEADEVGYLLEEVNRVLPGSHLEPQQVLATFAGARPLLAFSGSSTSASREHRIEVGPGGLVSVMGGKFTTYRRIAEEAVDAIVRRNRWRAERCLTDQVSVLEAVQPVSLGRWTELTRAVDPDLLARLLTRYGAATFAILQLIDGEPVLAQPVCPHHEHIAAELVHGFRQELACTLTDVLARRTRIAWSSCQGLDFLSTLAGLAQRYAGLTREILDRQVDEYHQFLQCGRSFLGPAAQRGVSRVPA